MPIFILVGIVSSHATLLAPSEEPAENLTAHVRMVTQEFPRLGIVVNEQQIWGSRTRLTLTVSGSEEDLVALQAALRPATFEQVDPFKMA
ncbi:hypothetical protein [Variovorax paradoxus]|uniref:hypothetical protein n=1 Tax=Variovorax paradoxus TaxID=34073 RepID=UPI003ECD13AB